MKLPLVIALGHKAKHGKDTACQAIKLHVWDSGSSVTIGKIAFADTLRAEVKAAADEMMDTWGYGPLDAMEALCKQGGVPFDRDAPVETGYPYGKQRKLYQWWGTEYRRAENPDYWVVQARSRIEKSGLDVIVISDMRFPNEGDLVKELGGFTVRVDRPGFDNGVGTEHSSETAMDGYPYDYVISASDEASLQKQAIELFEKLILRTGI